MTPTPSPTIAAIIPAAGASRRMGRSKPLLEFEGRPLIARVVSAFIEGGTRPVIVVEPPSDSPEGPAIAQAAAEAGGFGITPGTRPAEMRDSVELAIKELKRRGSPPAAVALAPADAPGIDGALVARLLGAWRENPDRIVIPTAGGRRGHPVVIPWRFVNQIPDLPAGVGINALIAERVGDVLEVDVADEARIADLDTPEDLQRLREAEGRQVRTVRLFAVARERVGRGEITVELPNGGTVADLRSALAEQFPPLAPIAARVMIAVDSEYADDAAVVPPGATLAVIPPVSGG